MLTRFVNKYTHTSCENGPAHTSCGSKRSYMMLLIIVVAYPQHMPELSHQ